MRANHHQHGGVVVLGLINDGPDAQILLIRKPHRPVGSQVLELPAGGIEAGEAPEVAAARELREETGYHAATLTPACRFHTAPGELAEPMHAFVARGLTSLGQDLDPGEHVEVLEWGLEDALSAVDDGRITDAKTMLTLTLARTRGLI